MKAYKKIVVRIAKILPDSIYLKAVFYGKLKQRLNLNNPKSYNEKLNWMKLHDRKDQYHEMVDKFEAKKYAGNIIGEEFIIPNYGIWNNFDDIDFSKLPDKFVLKTTHDSGGVVIINGKENMNISRARTIIEKSMKNNYYYLCREWPYKDIKPRIIAEKLISDSVPNDYKFYMFDGKMDSVMVCTNRDSGHPKFRFYDKEWNRLNYQKPEREPNSDVEKPDNFEVMVSIAEKLSAGLAHVRVDLYNVNGNIYFGELTLYNQGGFDTDISNDTDIKWGELIDLSKINHN